MSVRTPEGFVRKSTWQVADLRRPPGCQKPNHGTTPFPPGPLNSPASKSGLRQRGTRRPVLAVTDIQAVTHPPTHRRAASCPRCMRPSHCAPNHGGGALKIARDPRTLGPSSRRLKPCIARLRVQRDITHVLDEKLATQTQLTKWPRLVSVTHMQRAHSIVAAASNRRRFHRVARGARHAWCRGVGARHRIETLCTSRGELAATCCSSSNPALSYHASEFLLSTQ